MQRWVMHVDMDAFYAAVEQRDNPQYRGRPVVVGALPGGRGVAATCSYEARGYGIRSAMPISEAYRRCPDAVYLRPRMSHYARVSRQILAVLERVSPVAEAVSIDEAYIDVSGLERLVGSPRAIALRVKSDIRETIGLTASVGVGPNRLIAKLASDFDKPDGLVVVAPGEVRDFLAPLPVSDLRGVGRRTLPILGRLGLRTVAQLRELPLEVLQEHLGARAAVSLYRQARGIASDRVGETEGRKSISKESTFAEDVIDRSTLHDTLRTLAADVARTARSEGLAGRVVNLKIRFQGFDTRTRQRRLGTATSSERVMLEESWRLFEGGKLPVRPVRLIGLGLSDLVAPEEAQPDLFDQPGVEGKDRRVSEALDRINERFGPGSLHLGVSRKRTGRS